MNRMLTAAWDWFDARMPSVGEEFRKHASEYYAPKNFNFWYFFGALSLIVLVIQIVSGIFLTMNYKPDAALAFGSVEYIMRDVPGGWIIRYIHSTGASAFFVVVYLHMFRGLLYGSYQKPRELVWIFGVLIYLTPDGRGLLRLPAALGPDVVLGRAGDREPVRHHPVHRPGPVAADPRRLRDRRRDAEPLLRAARDRDSAGAARPGLGAHPRAARRRLEQSGRRRDQEEKGPRRPPSRRRAVPPVLHGEGFRRRGRLHDGVLRGAVLRAGDGRLLPRVQQLHSGRPAQDPAAHRAGLVLHAVLLDAARGAAAVQPRSFRA